MERLNTLFEYNEKEPNNIPACGNNCEIIKNFCYSDNVKQQGNKYYDPEGRLITETNDVSFYNTLIESEICYDNLAEYYFYKLTIVKILQFLRWDILLRHYKNFWIEKNKYKYGNI